LSLGIGFPGRQGDLYQFEKQYRKGQVKNTTCVVDYDRTTHFSAIKADARLN
jgi:hypothetical protein